MRFSIDPTVTDELVAEFASQLGKVGPRNVEKIDALFDGNGPLWYYEGLLAGYANALSVVDQSTNAGCPGPALGSIVAFVASKVRSLRPPSLRLCVAGCRIVMGRDTEMVVPAVEFAFYALLARRRKAGVADGFVAWDTDQLVEEYLREYRLANGKADGTFERVKRALYRSASIKDSHRPLRAWFEERKSRVNKSIRDECGTEFVEIYGIASKGKRPHVASRIDLDPDCIHVDDS